MRKNVFEDFISILNGDENFIQKLFETQNPDDFVKKSDLEKIFEKQRQLCMNSNKKCE